MIGFRYNGRSRPRFLKKKLSMKLLTLLFELSAPTFNQVFYVAVAIGYILLFYILYHLYKKHNVEQKADDQSAKTETDIKEKSQTHECEFDIQYVWDMEAETSCGSFHVRELIVMALNSPDALTPHDIFEVGRRVERLCDYAANLKVGDRYYSENMKHFDQCRKMMHTLQHRFNNLDKGVASGGITVSQELLDSLAESKEGLFCMLWNDNGVLKIIDP